MIEVLAPGALTTIQDERRTGAGSLGIAPSGPFDVLSHRAACMLVGESDTSLEITLAGPVLRFAEETVVALTGSAGTLTMDDDAVPWNRSFVVPAGRTLTVGALTGGARAYLAVRGGIGGEPVHGSLATHVGAGLGPQPLSRGVALVVGTAATPQPLRAFHPQAHDDPIRAIPLAGDRLFAGAWTVSARADRAGVRLEGPALHGAEIAPEAMLFGSVQVPPDGRPIVLGPDRPITGGYASIATVIEADLGAVARARPGDTLRFVPVTVEQARAAWTERARALAAAIEDL